MESLAKMDIPEYAELNVISNFSFLRGASHPEDLIQQAINLNYSAVAITDECSVAGVVKAYNAAYDRTEKTYRIKLIVGSEFWIESTNRPSLHCLLLAPSKVAYSELCHFITAARRRCAKGEYRATLKDLFKLQYCFCIWLPTHQSNSQKNNYISELKEAYQGRLWLGVGLFHQNQDIEHYYRSYEVSKNYAIPMVACNDVHMHVKEQKLLLDILTSIRLKIPVAKLGVNLFSNAERHLRSVYELQKLYPQALLDETMVIANQCNFSLSELKYYYPQELVPQHYRPIDYLRLLTMQGSKQRYPMGVSDKVQAIIEKELNLIEKMNYEYYFLTVHDIVFFARSNNILCQGRGSAANSAVCFCLGITSVDPSKVDLLFERFISEERDEPPDIDVDFEHERREEVIQYIYRKYTREKTALLATVITYRMRSAIRDVGKAIGLDPSLIARLSKTLAWWDKKTDLMQRFEDSNIAHSEKFSNYFHAMVQAILGFPRHLSQHVGGFLVSDRPVSSLVPIENASMADRTVIQWDKTDVETLGLLKIDVLALGMLTAIRKTLSYMQAYGVVYSDMAALPPTDKATYDSLCEADSVGVFQVESRAQMSMLPRLQPRNYYDLVIQIAIVRPGPIQGDMVHPYLQRRNKLEAVDYESPELEKVLKKTLGVPIFQEQVIQISMVAAGFSGGKADQLRRAMASWGKNGHLEPFKQELIQGMLARGYRAEFAERLYEQIKGFGSYGFPESHSASFALIAYASAYLKRHHPAAFLCGLLNSLPMGFYGPAQLIQDAQRHDVTILALDIDCSTWDHQLEFLHSDTRPLSRAKQSSYGVRLGLRLIKGFSQAGAARLERARNERRFETLNDLQYRAELNQNDLSALAGANAYPRFSEHRYQAHWDALAIESYKPLLFEHESSRNSTDERSAIENSKIVLEEPTEADNTTADYASFGLTLGRHPLSLLSNQVPFSSCKKAEDLFLLRHKIPVKIAGIVTCRQRPGTASGVLFLTLEDETGSINVIVWKATQENFRQAILQGRLLYIKGILERDAVAGKVVHVIAGYIKDMTHHLSDLQAKSRNGIGGFS